MSTHATGLKGLLILATSAAALPAAAAPVEYRTPNVINVAGATQVTLSGVTFVNSGLQGMARLPSSTLDFNGDTFGAFSSMDLNLSTWRKTATGYTGNLFALPDRGPNGIGQVTFSDYAGRYSSFSFTFTPYTGTANLPVATTSQNQMVLTQTGGLLFRDFNGRVTTGFDPGLGAAGVITQNGIPLPGPTTGAAAGKISLDAEGLRFLNDGNFYVSDEYGANVYYFNAAGQLQGVIRPPAALLPRDAAGTLSYSSLVDGTTGRRLNQGLEGVAVTPDNKKLVTLLQSAALQDSTANQQDRTNTRLMIYDITATRTPTTPVADYVLQLPILQATGNGGAPNRTAAQSELLALNDNQFLVLSRDGNGLGTATVNPVFKSVLLVDITGATNIAGTAFETSTTPISPGGVLNSTIRPVQQVELVNMLNATQLGKFGENLNNTAPTRLTLSEKWEGMALAPVLDEAAPNDYFLFVGNDNDFLSSTCRVGGQDCSQSVDSDAHILIYRLTLPTYVDPQYRLAMVRNGPVMVSTVGQAGLDVARAHSSNVDAHLSALRRAGWVTKGLSAWATGGYDHSDYDDFTAPGTPAKSKGFRGTVGVDFGLNDFLAAGVTVGYGEAKVKVGTGYRADADGIGYGASMRIYQKGFYGHFAYLHGNLNIDDVTRPGAYGLTATAEADGNSETVLAELGYSLDLPGLQVTPLAGYRYASAVIDPFTESGAIGGNIAVPRFTRSGSVGYGGAEVSWPMDQYTPFVTATYNKAFHDRPRTIALTLANTATVAMATETVSVPVTNENYWDVGVGIQGTVGAAIWHAGYNAQIGADDRFSHLVRAGVAFPF